MQWDSISDLATLGMWVDPGSYAYADDQHEIDPEVARRVCTERVQMRRDHAYTRMRGIQAHAHEHARMRSMRHTCADMRETLNYYVVKFVCKFVCSVGGQSYSNTDPSGIH